MKNEKMKSMDVLAIVCKFLLIVSVFAIPAVHAQDLNQPISAEDKATFDQMLTPVAKIYNFFKYTLSFVAGLAFFYGAGSIMFAGNDIRKKETGKVILASTLFGLAVIWASPYAIKMFTA